VYLTPGGDSAQYIPSLRLEDLEIVSPKALDEHAKRWGKEKITRAAQNILQNSGSRKMELLIEFVRRLVDPVFARDRAREYLQARVLLALSRRPG
jgi:hypothetical protein